MRTRRRGTMRGVNSLAFRCPGVEVPLFDLLLRALPGCAEETVESLVRARLVRVEGRPARNPARRVEPGQLVELAGDDLAERLPDALHPGVDSPFPLATPLATPFAAPLATPLASPLATTEAGVSTTGALEVDVLVREPLWRRGEFAGQGGALLFSVVSAREGVGELACVAPGGTSTEGVLARLAEAGYPVLGDTHRGGVLVPGGVRLRVRLPAHRTADAAPAPDVSASGDALVSDEIVSAETVFDPTWWPREPVFAGWPSGRGELPVLRVSGATSRILERGHPHILRDEDTSDPSGLAPGALARVETREQVPFGLAHVEGTGRVTARMWARGVASVREAATIEARVARALARRSALLEPAEHAPETNAYRLVHGEADALPGLFVDRLGPLLRVLVTSPGAQAYRQRAVDALCRALAPVLGPEPPVVEVLHTRDRPAGVFECVRLARGELDAAVRAGGTLPVREGGATFLVDPGFSEPERSSPGVGLFLDQRENRARLAALERRRAKDGGGRWLNLFAHTGAFSVALLRAGAREVTSVDLSGPYLARSIENVAVNALDPLRHITVRRDARRMLETLDPGDRFDGILLDPPTAAAAGRRFWSVARDLSPLIERSLAALAPRGIFFVARNDRGRGGLGALVREAASQIGVEISDPTPAPPGPDFPRLEGYPEGDPFSAVIATRLA